MDKNQQKICYKCNNFIRYYVKTKRKFIQIDHGHCKTLGINSSNRCKKITECSIWEELPTQNEIKKSIEVEIRNMCKRLKEIAEILKDGD